jgi:hypothetical protein
VPFPTDVSYTENISNHAGSVMYIHFLIGHSGIDMSEDRCRSDTTLARKREVTEAFGKFHTDIVDNTRRWDIGCFPPRIIAGIITLINMLMPGTRRRDIGICAHLSSQNLLHMTNCTGATICIRALPRLEWDVWGY